MTKFTIFGDSYVAHLGKFTGGRSEFFNCRFFGVSGMSTRTKFQDKFNEMKHYRPDVVFMNLGGNDITESTDIQNLVKRPVTGKEFFSMRQWPFIIQNQCDIKKTNVTFSNSNVTYPKITRICTQL